jgi:hypothetical protein
VSFYIPEVINQKIDDAVDAMGKRHGVQVDRSAVVSALLGNPDIWKPAALDQLVDRTVEQLTSRLTARLTNRPTSRPTGRLAGRLDSRDASTATEETNPSTEVEMRSVP